MNACSVDVIPFPSHGEPGRWVFLLPFYRRVNQGFDGVHRAGVPSGQGQGRDCRPVCLARNSAKPLQSLNVSSEGESFCLFFGSNPSFRGIYSIDLVALFKMRSPQVSVCPLEDQ